jgi:hypothetical protein
MGAAGRAAEVTAQRGGSCDGLVLIDKRRRINGMLAAMAMTALPPIAQQLSGCAAERAGEQRQPGLARPGSIPCPTSEDDASMWRIEARFRAIGRRSPRLISCRASDMRTRRKCAMQRRMPWRTLALVGLLLALAGCGAQFSGPPPPTQAEQLCKSWGYAPDDPVCLYTFHSTGGQSH